MENNVSERGYDVFTSFVTPAKQQEILNRMNDLFDQSGMTLVQLSKVTDISVSALDRYFNGNTKNPHFYTMVTMIIAMGGDIYDILGTSRPADAPAPQAENPYGNLLDAFRSEVEALRADREANSAALEKLSKAVVDLSGANRRKRILNIITASALFVFIILFAVLEIVDLCSPDWGRYQWTAEIVGNFLGKV